MCIGRASVQRGGGVLDPLACPGEGRHSLKMSAQRWERSRADMFSLGWFAVIDRLPNLIQMHLPRQPMFCSQQTLRSDAQIMVVN